MHEDGDATASLPPKAAPAEHWQFAVVAHPDPAFIGARAEVGVREVLLGRGGEALGPGGLDVESISRSHARIILGDGGHPRIEDVGSRNGTYVNGERVETRRLEHGDVVAVGSLLGLVLMERALEVDEVPSGFVAHSRGLRFSFAGLSQALQSGATLVHGESGAGASALVAAVLSAAQRDTAAWTNCGGTDWVVPELPDGSALILDAVDSLTSPQQRVLQQLLPELLSRGIHVISISTSSAAQLRDVLEPRLHNRLLRWEVRVPPLRERQADIVPLALCFAERFTGAAARFTPELTFALLRHTWPGNAHELEAIVERAIVDTPDAALIDVFEGLEAVLLSPPGIRAIGSVVTRRPGPGYAVERAGAWVEAPGGARHQLAHRPALSRLVAAFVEARERWPGRAMTVPELVERGWPGERIVPRAAANRVYVALTTLRKLGLRDLLVRTEEGYFFDAEVPLRIDAA